MNIREFFRPTGLKIILTFVFLLVIGLMHSGRIEGLVQCFPKGSNCPLPPPTIGDLLFLLAFWPTSFMMNLFGVVTGEIIGGFLSIIWNYFLASTIVFLYEKWKPAKNKLKKK